MATCFILCTFSHQMVWLGIGHYHEAELASLDEPHLVLASSPCAKSQRALVAESFEERGNHETDQPANGAEAAKPKLDQDDKK